jgi:LmbE family N-acetylglucosaminyl deacetylase
MQIGRGAWVVFIGVATTGVSAQQTEAPSVLLVTAHPDDDAMFAASVYRITHGLQGTVDLALMTDGSGGYRYSALAESIYGLDLTDETVARQYLPAIRKRELMAGGEIVGIRNYFFFDEYDNAYTENIDSILDGVWNTDRIRSRLKDVMEQGDYDFVFVHLPPPQFHAHHKAATTLALEVAATLPEALRPVVLGSFVGAQDDPLHRDFVEHPGYPITRVRADGPHFFFDRLQPLDETGRLNYHIIVNWLIAEHKSQGTMQLLMNRGDVERFWYFESNGVDRFGQTLEFFNLLNGIR